MKKMVKMLACRECGDNLEMLFFKTLSIEK